MTNKLVYSLLTLLLAGCFDTSDSNDTPEPSKTYSVTSVGDLIPSKTNPELMIAESISLFDGTAENNLPLELLEIIKIGESHSGSVFGQVIDADKNIITKSGEPKVSRSPDYFSLIKDGSQIKSISHIETTPAQLNALTFDVADDGSLELKDFRHIDSSDSLGGGRYCAGSVSPWSTHLGSEEIIINARTYDPVSKTGDKNVGPLTSYLGSKEDSFSPYHYGHVFETDPITEETVKHYSMGLYSVEQAIVLPDNKTSYSSNDRTYGNFYLFKADKSEDLSAGSLYAPIFKLDNATTLQGTIEWIDMGHTDSDSVKKVIDDGITFDNIFNVHEFDSDEGCQEGFTFTANSSDYECLQLKETSPPLEIISRLETNRVASFLGANLEFTQPEGITYNSKKHVLYLALSQIDTSMQAGYPDLKDFITLEEKNECGTILEIALDDNNVATSFKAIITGIETDDKCDPSSIANPDNIHYSPELDVLFIAEDSNEDRRDQNYVWIYQPETQELLELMTVPNYDEPSSINTYNIDGYLYITLAVQGDNAGLYYTHIPLK